MNEDMAFENYLETRHDSYYAWEDAGDDFNRREEEDCFNDLLEEDW
jgi:hypothetical protein